MARIDWRIKGPEISACNCDYGCPCQFNALPTRGQCTATVAMRIDEGHFGKTDLKGVKFAACATWPGAIHEGKGTIQAAIDDKASEAQRHAMLEILQGHETEPGATIFQVFSTVIDTMLPPLFLPIKFEADMAKGTGSFSAPGFTSANFEPIRNPVTGKAHRAKVTLPTGFEYHDAEYVSSSAKASGGIKFDWSGRHGHMARLDMGPAGPAHP